MFWFFGLKVCGMDSSSTGDQTHNPCIKRQNLYHCMASEVTQSFEKCKTLGNMNEILPGKRNRERKLKKGCLEISVKKKYQTQGTYKL